MQIVESLELNNIVGGVYMLVMWMSGRMHDVCVPAVCVCTFSGMCVFSGGFCIKCCVRHIQEANT